jgi:hypothetical protein
LIWLLKLAKALCGLKLVCRYAPNLAEWEPQSFVRFATQSQVGFSFVNGPLPVA